MDGIWDQDMNKVNTGYSLFPTRASRLTTFPGVRGFVDSSSEELLDSCTGRSSYVLRTNEEENGSKTPSGLQPTASCPGAPRQKNTCGRRTPESPTPSSSLGRNPLKETQKKTGKQYGNLQRRDGMKKWIRRYEWYIIELSEPSLVTIRNQLEWSELATFSGVELAVVSHAELGKKREWTLTLNVPCQNSGVATVAKKTLSSMNFVEVSRSATCSDGLIDIQSTLKLRDQAFPWQQKTYG